MRIEGKVKGTIDISGQLLVAADGTVEAKVSASTVTVAGEVVGDILAAEKIELEPTAKVQGNITAPKILINEGATFDGQVAMKDGKPKPPVVPQPNLSSSSARRDEENKDDKN